MKMIGASEMTGKPLGLSYETNDWGSRTGGDPEGICVRKLFPISFGVCLLAFNVQYCSALLPLPIVALLDRS